MLCNCKTKGVLPNSTYLQCDRCRGICEEALARRIEGWLCPVSARSCSSPVNSLLEGKETGSRRGSPAAVLGSLKVGRLVRAVAKAKSGTGGVAGFGRCRRKGLPNQMRTVVNGRRSAGTGRAAGGQRG